ncbi:molybdopterin adenylyltransferase [Roseimaritima ulvae]|uniref:Molybdopterin adenylyltransferase n=1 Tax=Roseimaritima ulvae TaxID=980254 RepID=A0A5B9QNT7_9BACT|nr:molybdopterin adenylyltransferase [Roseimaritima ulvae]QEG40634.1 Molybdopterin adenylyltransferase [Roseimaritima ulvae]
MGRLAIGILTVSDRASRGEYTDRGGPAIEEYLAEVIDGDYRTIREIVCDELAEIANALIRMADQPSCGLVITTGGTGPAPRDVTPEATHQVCDKMLPGFGEQMRQVSLQYVPTAILSRQTAGVRGTTLIVNLPGQPRAIAQCLDAIFPAIPYCLELIEAGEIKTNASRFTAFLPKK